MPHRLMKRDPHNAVGRDPIAITMRYQCDCANGEVLAITTVIDLNEPDERFIWTMRRMIDDVRIEVRQHLERPVPLPPRPQRPIVASSDREVAP